MSSSSTTGLINNGNLVSSHRLRPATETRRFYSRHLNATSDFSLVWSGRFRLIQGAKKSIYKIDETADVKK